jgi:autophagy-related protein 5
MYYLFSVCSIASGESLTLKHLMVETLPRVFATDEDFQSTKIVIHGIEPPLETPLQWLSEHFSYPDNFLHIILVSSEA